MPSLVRLVMGYSVLGASLGVAFAVAMIATDAAGLRSLLAEVDDPVTPVVLLSMGCASLMAALLVAAAAMAERGSDEDADQ